MGTTFSRAAGCVATSATAPQRRLPPPPPPPPPALAYPSVTDPLLDLYYDHGFGHSFCYIRPSPDPPPPHPTSSPPPPPPPPLPLPSSDLHPHRQVTWSVGSATSETSFKTISGASVSANTSTPRTVAVVSSSSANGNSSNGYEAQAAALPDDTRAAAFEATASFNSLPLQPVPRGAASDYISSVHNYYSTSGPIISCGSGSSTNGRFSSSDRGFLSGPIERAGGGGGGGGFLSGPLERGFLSGPMERGSASGPNSAELVGLTASHGGGGGSCGGASSSRRRSRLMKLVRKLSFQGTMSRSRRRTSAPPDCDAYHESSSSSDVDLDDDSCCSSTENLQWAYGRAGEDRMHVVLSEDHGWLYVGIYDGFNGPDAPDFLMTHLYRHVYKQLRGLLWDRRRQDDGDGDRVSSSTLFIDPPPPPPPPTNNRAEPYDRNPRSSRFFAVFKHRINRSALHRSEAIRQQNPPSKPSGNNGSTPQRKLLDRITRNGARVSMAVEKRRMLRSSSGTADHSAVLAALQSALEATEMQYMRMAERSMEEMPELALMGSCVLVMLMKGADVYVMNVGDSRAIVARAREGGGGGGGAEAATAQSPEKIGARDWQLKQELERIIEEAPAAGTEAAAAAAAAAPGTESKEGGVAPPARSPVLAALQLSSDHSTNIEEEVARIRAAHPEDGGCIVKERVKGRLKVTRAFGAGFLKAERWNEALLEMFRVVYVGEAPYVTCEPALHHHALGPEDRFLVLSSDGLYQYLTNEEVVAGVEWFMDAFPDGDPAQYLIEQLLFRAARNAGMDFHELLEIPHGDRRKYHDDVCVMVISLEGRIWRSFG